ncbi:helix-turn-helix domain-containing protein [Sphingobacterium sp. SYP-B4668]|uniref:helix-turn-helix domain-containing protein n=1 Tax=Sphingobacterium sp. SYP-B4668 TaxID=2996035 RepID=UPI0022DDF8D4|nr:AraC family transcriptional regulator [Sphingobacterium sp. SYP-B4668]
MQSQSYLPHESLRPYVQCFVYSCVGDPNDVGLQELDLFPVGYSLMAFILKESHQLFNFGTNKSYDVRFNFTGQLDRYHHLLASSSSMIYVLFKPHGAYQLLGIPQHLLKNECTSLFDLMGSSIHEIFSKMEDQAHSPKAVIALLEQWLLQQFHRHRHLDTNRIRLVCEEIILHKGKLSIQELNSTCGMSKSSMEHYFKEQVGLSPKVYSRIVRFNQLNRFLRAGATTDWMEIVDRYGYFDQSHFIHEFKHFFGYSPSQMHLSYQNLAEHITSIDK